jgi:hypothetical protein
MIYEERKLLELRQEIEDMKMYIKHYKSKQNDSEKLEYYTYILDYLQEKYAKFIILQKGINS